MDSVDFVIVTALDEERDAIISHMPDVARVDPSEADVRVYWRCVIPVVKLRRIGQYEVVLVSLASMGRIKAANATTDAIRRWNPRYVILVGIAGGIAAAGVRLGDVLISDQVVDYELQKVTSDGVSVRYQVYPADARLLNAARNLINRSWQPSIRARRPRKGATATHFGPIATGDKVVAFKEFLQCHGSSWPKLIGVEMEAGGAAAAAFEAPQRPGFFMIRGVSDLADDNKDSKATSLWRQFACAGPAGFLFEFLKSAPVPMNGRLEPNATDSGGGIADNDSLSGSGTISVETAVDKAEIELRIPGKKPSEMLPAEREALMRAVANLLDIDGVTIKRIREGSTIITLQLTPAQAERLLWAAKAGALAAFGVDDAWLGNDVNSSRNARMWEGVDREERDRLLDEIDREVREAMAAMAPDDVAEIAGHMPMDAGHGSIDVGSDVIGTVVSVTDDDIFLEFGPKAQGLMPRNHFGKKEKIEVGRRVDAVIERFDDAAGLWIVSRKGAAQRATWTTLQPGMLVEGRATGVVKGGLEIDLKGIRAFMPASHADIIPMKDISLLLNQILRCEVLEVDRRHKNVLLSRRKVQEKEREELKIKLKEELEVGQVRDGVVKTIMDYGAFVDLGGVDGLLHVKDLSWGMVEKVSDVLSPGQNVQVMVLKIDREKDRISLGLKQAQRDPWVTVAERWQAGNSLKVRIIRIADFGAFAELEPGVEGLIPVSEMAWSRLRSPSEVVKVGEIVDCVVLRVEPDRRRIALSMKQAQADPWAGVLNSYTVNTTVKGKVTRLADFGVFVELVPGVEGLLHISELADKHVKHCGEVVQPGQEIEPRVIGIDRENRRISLSLKQPKEAPMLQDYREERVQESAKKPRKTPRRGGLASHFEW